MQTLCVKGALATCQFWPGLSCAGSVCALIKTIQAFAKFGSKLDIQKILLATGKHPGSEDTNLLMGGVVKNWKNLEKKYYLKWKPLFGLLLIKSNCSSCIVTITLSDKCAKFWSSIVALTIFKLLLCKTTQFVLFRTSIWICTEPSNVSVVRLGCSESW